MTAAADPDSSPPRHAVAMGDALYGWELETQPRNIGDNFLAMIVMAGVSGLSRDRVIISSHWTDMTGTKSPLDLATQLASGMTTWMNNQSHLGDVTIYKSDFSPAGTPHPPLASVHMTGTAIGNHGPGEIALCMSYYSVFNIKRNRGRNYIPFDWIYTGQVSGQPPGARPNATEQNVALGLWNTVYKPVDHGGDFDWVLKSRVDKQHKAITDVWVDNEWDTMRSRGLRGDSRVTAKT